MSTNKLFDIERLIAVRQKFHKYPEIGFEEVETQKTIKEYLLSIGVSEDQIRICAKTGLVVDISGKGPKVEGPHKTIAFRADMDALLMSENNPQLEYHSVTKAAHMCGHDGHMACMLGGVSLLMENIDMLPENRTARILFQPGEEGVGGALAMVKENCLEGVHEVWGFHNVPWDPVGNIFVKTGAMMAGVRFIKIFVEGKGGHSSLKDQLHDPVFPAYEFAVEAEKILVNEFAEWNNKELIFSLPSIESSKSANVFPDRATISGTLRNFNEEVASRFLERLYALADEISARRNVKINVTIPFIAPMVSNDKTLTEELKAMFGDKVTDENVPIRASEDFSEFAERVPGCFFFVGVGKPAGFTLHVDNYNFNDDVIADVSQYWLKIMQEKLNMS